MRHERHIYEDKRSGRWYFRFYVKGRRYQTKGFKTRDECRRAYARAFLGAESSPSAAPTPGAITVKDAVRQYLTAQRPYLADSTQVGYERSLGRFVAAWGRRALTSLTSDDVQAWAIERRQEVDKGATVNRDVAALSALLSWAKAKPRRWVTENAAGWDLVDRFDEPWRPYQTITPAELAVVLPVLKGVDKHDEEPIKVQLMVRLGVRLGVVLDLRWEQVDMANKVIQYRSKGKDMIRDISDPVVLGLLESLTPQVSGWVFQTRRTPWTLYQRWYTARAAIGKPKLRLHDLRVTFAREMANAGVDLDTIRVMLGHSSLGMTTRYVPQNLDSQRHALTKRRQFESGV